MALHKSSLQKKDAQVLSLKSAILNARGIVFICGKHDTKASKPSVACTDPDPRVGAGISVAAGIPDFRSKQKIPGVPELAQRHLKDMFSLSMITVSVFLFTHPSVPPKG